MLPMDVVMFAEEGVGCINLSNFPLCTVHYHWFMVLNKLIFPFNKAVFNWTKHAAEHMGQTFSSIS